MAFPLLPSKRPYERNPLEHTGRGKCPKTGPSITLQNQVKVPPGAIIFRILCPASKSGSVIGKGGGIVARIRQQTGAKIRLEETVPGCNERVIVITGFEKDAELGSKQSKEDDEGAGTVDGVESAKENTDNTEGTEDSAAADSSKLDGVPSSAVKALVLVFERLIEEESENDDEDETSKKLSTVSARLLVLSGQVGCVLGKGGSVIKQMSTDSGAQIRILPRDKLPLCASQQDEIVQVTGGVESVKKALHLVAQQLLDNPPREHDLFLSLGFSGPSSDPFASIPRAEGLPPPNFQYPPQVPPFSNRSHDIMDFHPGIGPPFPKFHESGPPLQPQVSPEPITYRLLCSNDKVGSVIGKGGNIVKGLKNDTGCEIKVLETTPESEDRIIVISGLALPSDRIAPVQDAVLRVQHRLVMAVPDTKESIVLSRLLVASNQTGCLLGKGGSIIADMRKLSGAHIRILGKEQIPKGVPENDEVIQISGEFGAVQEALLQITARLKLHVFRDKLPTMNPNMPPAFVKQLPPYGLYMGRRESSPPRLYRNLPPFQKDPVGRSVFAHPVHGSGIPLGIERPAPWPPQVSCFLYYFY
ncbi:KH domain [Musa troglodytarum]|uniref:KH domain n=1 Tax=Musa troglodytarum TaxID=320322 RepID=A0A9E7LBV1_9LILI|nr:KH domain [Musa troglodytarum]